MKIRTAEPAEYAAIGEMTRRVYVEAPGSKVRGEYADHLLNVADRAASTDVLVAVDDDGTVLGAVAYVGRGGPYAELASADEAEFRMLAVGEKAQGRGVGTALVEECIARSRALGRARVVLSTSPWMAPAHRMYERLGFVRTPDRDWDVTPELRLMTYSLDL